MKNKQIILVTIDDKYCDYLRNFDSRVPFNHDNKKLRPFVGILFEINKCKYFAPLSSPKPKHLRMHDTLDFLRLDEGKLGAINFNNMLPVTDDNITILDLNNNKNDIQYNNLLKSQIYWLNRNKEIIYTKAKALYFDFTNNNLGENLRNRCCDFLLLENVCKEYKKDKQQINN